MSTPVLSTKLYIPPPRSKEVLRPRLIERLNDGLHRKLTLISAPAGFGKTTLLSEWIANCERLDPTVQAVWLSLDEGDNDPARFLTYLIAAFQTRAPDMGKGVLGALQSPQSPSIEFVLTTWLNEITTLLGQFVLVLDDYHVIDAKPDDALTSVNAALNFLLEHLPPQVHLVIATREDPDLSLARLRARGQLTELRAKDLRFIPSEAAEFLDQVMGLRLSAEDIATLETRTEGWIAGLQLAALSMQGRQDVSEFIGAFAGDHRYIVDYLVEEVLKCQPEPVRQFLLQTAILDRLNGPLCDAVTGQEEGSTRLEALERGNFFVVPLDDKRHWYRYHQLFAEVLYTRLKAEQPDRISVLHRRASEWFEHHGSTAEAIRHALAAQDFDRAADLVELALPVMRQTRQEATALGWLRAFPDELVQCRPVLSVGYAWALLVSGKFESVEARLHDAERWLNTTAGINAPPAEARLELLDSAQDKLCPRMVVADEDEFNRLPGTIAVFRAACAQAVGDVANTLKYARQVLDLVPEDDHLRRGSAAGFMGLAYWTSGDLEAAYQYYAACMASVQKAGHLSDVVGCAIALADIRIAQGRLREAMSTYERALQLATGQGAPVLRGAADMYVGLGELYREQNDLGAAAQYLLKSKELGEQAGLPQNPYRWRVAMARVREAQGDLDGALDLLEEAERVYAGDFFPNVRPVAAFKTRAWVALGRFDEALDWVRERGLSAHDDLDYLREFEHITLARVLLAQYQRDHPDGALQAAIGLLERLLKAAEEGQRTGSVIEILVLQALAHQMRGDIPAALTPLERALALAEPEGYIRMFVDEGPSLAFLLEKVAKRAVAPNYIRQLLRALGKVEDRTPVQQVLTDPLSERELQVLRLLGTDLSGPDMARELVVSLNTLRTHAKSIYTKLGVNSRRAAVHRAEELNLL